MGTRSLSYMKCGVMVGEKDFSDVADLDQQSQADNLVHFLVCGFPTEVIRLFCAMTGSDVEKLVDVQCEIARLQGGRHGKAEKFEDSRTQAEKDEGARKYGKVSGPRVAPDVVARVRSLRSEGKTLGEIVAEVGLGLWVVRRCLRGDYTPKEGQVLGIYGTVIGQSGQA